MASVVAWPRNCPVRPFLMFSRVISHIIRLFTHTPTKTHTQTQTRRQTPTHKHKHRHFHAQIQTKAQHKHAHQQTQILTLKHAALNYYFTIILWFTLCIINTKVNLHYLLFTEYLLFTLGFNFDCITCCLHYVLLPHLVVCIVNNVLRFFMQCSK